MHNYNNCRNGIDMGGTSLVVVLSFHGHFYIKFSINLQIRNMYPNDIVVRTKEIFAWLLG